MEEDLVLEQFIEYLRKYLRTLDEYLMHNVPTGNELIVTRGAYGYTQEVLDLVLEKKSIDITLPEYYHPLKKFHINEPTAVVSGDFLNIGKLRAHNEICHKLSQLLVLRGTK